MYKCDGALGVVFVLSCRASYVFVIVDNFFLFSVICASRLILVIEVEKIRKTPANEMCITLACLLSCVCFAHVL